MIRRIPLLLASTCLLILSAPSHAATLTVVSDFEDGTLQGWTPDPNDFEGIIQVDPFGNPGNAMLGFDSGPGGVAMFVQGPSAYTGDLSMFRQLRWDEFLFDNGPPNSFRTGVILRGEDGTEFEFGFETGTPREIWVTNTVALVASDWRRRSGNASFEDVLAAVDSFIINLDASGLVSVNEARVDNITLSSVPLPGGLVLLIGGLGALATRRSRASQQA